MLEKSLAGQCAALPNNLLLHLYCPDKNLASHFMLDCKRSLNWIFSFLPLCKNTLELRNRELVGSLSCFYPCAWQLCKWSFSCSNWAYSFGRVFWLFLFVFVCVCVWFLLLFGLWVGFCLLFCFFFVVLLSDLKMRLMEKKSDHLICPLLTSVPQDSGSPSRASIWAHTLLCPSVRQDRTLARAIPTFLRARS